MFTFVFRKEELFLKYNSKEMKKISILVILFCSFLSFCFSQKDIPAARSSMTVAFYNVENLFDYVNDSAADDEEFLPDSPKNWNGEKYQKKINDLAKVVSSLNTRELPAIIGLAEVENEKVLRDLAQSQKLRRGNYELVHYDSKDERGIDVALLYNPDEVQLVDSRPIPVTFGQDIDDLTRDILYARFKADDNNTYHVFVNHWPSRSPNREDSEIKRIAAALVLRKEVDLIFNNDNSARIIILGDFNDEPTNRSLIQILNATNKRKNTYYRDLYNLMYDPHNIAGEGTITYDGNWQMFDQIIVSYSLFEKSVNYYLTFEDGKVYKDEQVISADPETGKEVISRTYSGNVYKGGTSDHLPVYIILRKDRE